MVSGMVARFAYVLAWPVSGVLLGWRLPQMATPTVLPRGRAAPRSSMGKGDTRVKEKKMAQRIVQSSDQGHSGIDISYVKRHREVRVSGWYDTYGGIEGRTYPLGAFLSSLGVTLKDCIRELKEMP